jgi:branched-chain amino acid transport system substrate-binding protein
MKNRGNRLLAKGITRRELGRVAVGLGAGAALATAITPFNIVRAQSKTLKIGVLWSKSGVQAFFGQSCQRGADISPALLKELGYTANIEIISADTESNIDVARSRAEKLISDGANMLIGAFDSGQTAAIAQVAEQHGVPHVINIAAADQITEQGYKFVFRNFTTSLQLVGNGLPMIKQYVSGGAKVPKTGVFLHLNDTFGMTAKAAIDKLFPAAGMPFTLLDSIAYDPLAKDLSLEIAKAKATGAEVVMLASRLNDAKLLVREMVKARWEPMGIMSAGSPGMYDQQFYDDLGKYSEYCVSSTPWYNPHSEAGPKMIALFQKAFPKDSVAGNIFNVTMTCEAVMVCADAFQRAGTTDGKALAYALRTTNIPKRIATGGPISFDAKGQQQSLVSALLQNLHLHPAVVLPKSYQEDTSVFPMPGWNSPEREKSAVKRA